MGACASAAAAPSSSPLPSPNREASLSAVAAAAAAATSPDTSDRLPAMDTNALGFFKGGLLFKRPVEKEGRWQKRFFAIVDTTLLYYVEKEYDMFLASQRISPHPRGFLPLLKSTIAVLKDPGMDFAFEVSHPAGLSFRLAASSAIERDNWMAALRAVISSSSSSVPRSPQHSLPLAATAASPGLDMSVAAATSLNKSRVPTIGDHVLALHAPTTCFYMATIVAFDKASVSFTVDWDDGDPSGRVIPYSKLALDIIPQPNDVGIGTIVIFPQGRYVGGQNNTGGRRFHEGRIERVTQGPDGVVRYDGRHTQTVEMGKMNFRAYEETFSGLTLEELRLAPNVLDILESEEARSGEQAGAGSGKQSWDIFLSYNHLDSQLAIRSGEVEHPPSYGSLVKEATDPRAIKERLEAEGYSVWIDTDFPDASYPDIVHGMTNSKILVFCVSNSFSLASDQRMQFQFAKKTLKKPIIPLVVEAYQNGPPWDWQATACGMLLAGELYIDFTDIQNQEAKFSELMLGVRKLVSGVEEVQAEQARKHPPASDPSDVFVSYCWSNSESAHKAGQVSTLAGTEHNDPRRFAEKMQALGHTVWLDIWRLESGSEGTGMFEQIAAGLRNSKLVVVFVSSEYARSDNCRMESQFAAKSLRKPIIPVVCGTGDEWQSTVVGMLVAGLSRPTINLQKAASAAGYDQVHAAMTDLMGQTASMGAPPKPLAAASGPAMSSAASSAASAVPPMRSEAAEAHVHPDADGVKPVFRAPQIGDKVLSYHTPTTCFYQSTIESFNRATMEFTVNWHDNDTTGRTMRYDEVAIDRAADADEIAVGSHVIFKQGEYVLPQQGTRGHRYHKGVVTAIKKAPDGQTIYEGHHLLTPAMGKMNFRAYVYEFSLPLADLRMAPNAMDVLAALSG